MKQAWIGLAVGEEEGGDLAAPRLFSFPQAVSSSVVTATSLSIVTKQGELWRCDFDSLEWLQVAVSVPVKAVACAPEATFVVGGNGRIWAWGADAMQSGILGLGSLFAVASPTVISALSEVHIVQVAAGEHHAAAIDSTSYLESGKVYTWGSSSVGELGDAAYVESQVQPHVLTATRAFSIRKVLCSSHSTSILTIGGFLYFFGHLSSIHPFQPRPPNRPKAPSHLEDLYAVDICLGAGLLALVSESGAVYAVDDCLELVQFPSLAESKVQFIAATASGIYGLSSKRTVRKRRPTAEMDLAV